MSVGRSCGPHGQVCVLAFIKALRQLASCLDSRPPGKPVAGGGGQESRPWATGTFRQPALRMSWLACCPQARPAWGSGPAAGWGTASAPQPVSVLPPRHGEGSTALRDCLGRGRERPGPRDTVHSILPDSSAHCAPACPRLLTSAEGCSGERWRANCGHCVAGHEGAASTAPAAGLVPHQGWTSSTQGCPSQGPAVSWTWPWAHFSGKDKNRPAGPRPRGTPSSPG